MSILELENLEIKIGDTVICRELSLLLEGGRLLGILGRNGAGKTTLLHTIMGFRPFQHGAIRIQQEDLHAIPRQQLATKIGLLFQESENSLPATVLETVMLGRHPHSENLLWDSPADVAYCRETLSQMGLGSLENRQVSTLSGGEKQRLAIALLLAQNPKVLLLDEPSNHLDIDYQIKILSLLHEKSRKQNAAMIIASHDINLVSRFCDDVLLLLEDGNAITGPIAEVLDTQNLERAFGCKVECVQVSGHHYYLPK